MLKTGAIIEFDRKKYFKYIRPLGSGGTGDSNQKKFFAPLQPFSGSNPGVMT